LQAPATTTSNKKQQQQQETTTTTAAKCKEVAGSSYQMSSSRPFLIFMSDVVAVSRVCYFPVWGCLKHHLLIELLLLFALFTLGK
jgi:hypothetical protein